MDHDEKATAMFRIDRSNEVLLRDGDEIALRPKTWAVLCALIDRPDQLCSKDLLLDEVWPDTFVTDTVLKVCIRELRQALDDDPKAPRFIKTIPRKGYRLIRSIPVVEPSAA
ncbi:MAG: winged helix-turn-helix domain-containing protein, partial [Acidobacteriota bacterium]